MTKDASISSITQGFRSCVSKTGGRDQTYISYYVTNAFTEKLYMHLLGGHSSVSRREKE